MKNLFLISDTHFGHENALKFTINESGTLLRPGFSCVEEMDEHMVNCWNRTVKPGDHVYHLGDVAIAKRCLPIVKRLNGKKRLVMGNHDIYDVRLYLEAGFQKVMAYRVFEGCIFSHIPIYAGGLGRFKLNIHGHLHATPSPEGPYHCVCVEQVDYTPVAFDTLSCNKTT